MKLSKNLPTYTGVNPDDPMVGRQFGYLKVDSRYINTDRGAKQYQCQCGLGKWKLIRADKLRTGATKSCGCIKSGQSLPIKKVGQPFVEQMRANFYFEKPANGKQFSFVMVKDIVGTRVAEKTEHGYFLTTAAYRPTTPGRINTIVPIFMKRLFEAGIISAQGKRTISVWMHDEGITFNPHMRGFANSLSQDHAALSRGEDDDICYR